MAEDEKSSDAFFGFLAGAAAGAVAALLLAPGPGKQTRRRLERFLSDLLGTGPAESSPAPRGKSRERQHG